MCLRPTARHVKGGRGEGHRRKRKQKFDGIFPMSGEIITMRRNGAERKKQRRGEGGGGVGGGPVHRCDRRERKKWPLAIVERNPPRSFSLPAARSVSRSNKSFRPRTDSLTNLARTRVSLNRACCFFRSAALVIIAANVHGSASRAARFTTLRIPRIYDVPCKNDRRARPREVFDGWNDGCYYTRQLKILILSECSETRVYI